MENQEQEVEEQQVKSWEAKELDFGFDNLDKGLDDMSQELDFGI